MDVLGQGRQATVFSDEDETVVKVFEAWVDEPAARREAELCDAVFRAGAPAPRVDGVKRVDGRWAIRFERMPGPMMLEEFLASDPIEVASDLGRLAAKIHAIDGSGFEDVRDQWLRRTDLPELRRVEAGIRETSADLPIGTSLLHTDLHPMNVMRNRSGGWTAIDWEGAARGHPAADLCRTLFLLVEADPPDGPSDPALADLRKTAGAACLAAYRETSTASKDADIDSWRPMMLAARLGENIPHERPRLLEMLQREWRASPTSD